MTPPAPNMKLVGKIIARCPIYVLNLTYKCKDKDPFYPIDKVILEAINEDPATDISYLAWLIGFEREIVQSRIQYHLIPGKFLDLNAEGKFVVTDSGERKYLKTGNDRPDVDINGSVMVDGSTLRVWPEMFYDEEFNISYRQGKTTSPHRPILGLKDPIIAKAAKELEAKIKNSNFSYGLEDDAHSLEVINYEDRYIDDIKIALWANDKGNVIKQEIYKDQVVDIPALASTYKKYYFYFSDDGMLHQNQGATVDADADKKVLSDSSNYLWNFIALRYKIKKPSTILIEQTLTYNCSNPQIYVTKELLQESSEKRLLLADTEKGQINATANEGGVLYISLIAKEDIKPYLIFDKAYEKWNKEIGMPDMEFVETIKDNLTINWREAFCLTSRFEALEKIDRSQFFKFE